MTDQTSELVAKIADDPDLAKAIAANPRARERLMRRRAKVHRRWLIEQVRNEAAKYKQDEAEGGDFNLARGIVLLDVGHYFVLLTPGEIDRLHGALFEKRPEAAETLLG